MAEARARLPNARHERRDVRERDIWIAFVALLGLLIATAWLALRLYPQSVLDRTIELPLPLFPAPRLQSNPTLDMQRYGAQQWQQLHSSGWMDQAHTLTHIPIDVAMGAVAQEGIPDWPRAPERSP